ncbi:MAG: imidazoleglycerol-phosphate dehydratase HisB [Alphaproteobacteria bacterium]|nr:imidazoleglycerol-phosphate dehydratase HisB [Alphaproteobacteria bacterium]
MTKQVERKARISRKTEETEVTIEISLDGHGCYKIDTDVGFFDHMLAQFSRHSLVDMNIFARGDTQIDSHHLVEDVGITLGQAFKEALGDKSGISRYADVALPMDEALLHCALDISGRSFLRWDVAFGCEKIGSFDVDLVEEFFRAFVNNAALTLHVRADNGVNSHHIAEACFKCVARALSFALLRDPRQGGRIPSTKGNL